MNEQLDFIKEIQKQHQEQLTKLNEESEKKYFELKQELEAEKHCLVSERDVKTKRDRKKSSVEITGLKTIISDLEKALERSQGIIKEKSNQNNQISKKNFDLMEELQKLKRE